jgi:hypothetical protein
LKEEEILEHLVDLAKRLDFDVRFDRGSFQDGACRVHAQNLIILNRASPTAKQVAALGRALAGKPLDGIFLLPAIRDVIERAGKTSEEASPPNDGDAAAEADAVPSAQPTGRKNG